MEDRSIPRHQEKSPCQKCGGKGWLTERMKNGDSNTTLCTECVPKPKVK